MGKSYDWDKWRRVYVTSEDPITLETIASLPDAPAIDTLKKRSALESWPEQRKQYMHQVSTKAARNGIAVEAVAKVDQLLDRAELITRHTKLARWLISLGGKILTEAEDISPHVALQMIKLGLEEERLCLGMESDRIAIEFNPEALTDEELRAIASESNG